MDIEIICVGKVKEKYWNQAIQEYLKRLKNYAKVKLIEVPDQPCRDGASPGEEQAVLDKEAALIQSKIEPGRKVIVLAIEGKLISSEELAQKIDDYASYGSSHLTFIIGGSLGLAESLKQSADWSISFGRITYPHQMMRVILLEQIYRSFRIIHGHAYHK